MDKQSEWRSPTTFGIIEALNDEENYRLSRLLKTIFNSHNFQTSIKLNEIKIMLIEKRNKYFKDYSTYIPKEHTT